MSRFFRVSLRTIDVEAARTFYTRILGDVPPIFQLHERARAQGAPPHWLGLLDVDDVDRAVETFVAHGAAPLGPKWGDADGLEAANVRDPGGAVVSLATPPANARGAALATPEPEVAWYLLHTSNLDAVKAVYAKVAGWEFSAPFELGAHGTFHPFAWQAGGATVGAMCDIRARPGVHPHWLFHFRVEALDAALEAVKTSGGVAVGPFDVPGGDRVAVCDDPQGAAFALYERAAK